MDVITRSSSLEVVWAEKAILPVYCPFFVCKMPSKTPFWASGTIFPCYCPLFSKIIMGSDGHKSRFQPKSHDKDQRQNRLLYTTENSFSGSNIWAKLCSRAGFYGQLKTDRNADTYEMLFRIWPCTDKKAMNIESSE